MPNSTPNTGSNQVNSNLKSAVAGLAGPAAQLASGASVFQVAATTMHDALLDKLLGPTTLLAGGLIGVLKTVRDIVRESGVLERGLNRIASVQQIQGKFETLLKSATVAKQRIQELYKFTASSPFSFQDVAEANLDLAKQIDQYRANGLTEGQARSDFDASIRAQALSSGPPRVIADSLQSIGGGGGFSEVSPLLASQKRIEDYHRLEVKFLELIAGSVKSASGVAP